MKDVCILIEAILLFFGLAVILVNVFESLEVCEAVSDAVYTSTFFAIMYVFRNSRLESL